MGLLLAAVWGLIIGAIARYLYPGPNPMSHLRTMLLGVGGGFVAGLLGRFLGWYSPGRGGPGIIASVLCAMLIIWAGRKLESAKPPA